MSIVQVRAIVPAYTLSGTEDLIRTGNCTKSAVRPRSLRGRRPVSTITLISMAEVNQNPVTKPGLKRRLVVVFWAQKSHRSYLTHRKILQRVQELGLVYKTFPTYVFYKLQTSNSYTKIDVQHQILNKIFRGEHAPRPP